MHEIEEARAMAKRPSVQAEEACRKAEAALLQNCIVEAEKAAEEVHGCLLDLSNNKSNLQHKLSLLRQGPLHEERVGPEFDETEALDYISWKTSSFSQAVQDIRTRVAVAAEARAAAEEARAAGQEAQGAGVALGIIR
eukprot:1126629-Prymnesium_polylepis.4